MSLRSALAIVLAMTQVVPAHPTPQDFSIQIIGGEPASLGDFPYIVSMRLYLSNGETGHNCGGVLLNSQTVLTAAHCLENRNPSEYFVRAGSLTTSSGGVVANVSSTVLHPQWDNTTLKYDFGIAHLATPIEASEYINYVKLPEAGSDPVPGSAATTAGWGFNDTGFPEELYKVTVPITERASCQEDYRDFFYQVTDEMICAAPEMGGQDACSGDSGGPIVDTETDVLTGLVSWGNGCALADYPGVYARVSIALDFIAANL